MQDLESSGSIQGKVCLIKVKIHLGRFKLDGSREISLFRWMWQNSFPNMSVWIPSRGCGGCRADKTLLSVKVWDMVSWMTSSKAQLQWDLGLKKAKPSGYFSLELSGLTRHWHHLNLWPSLRFQGWGSLCIADGDLGSGLLLIHTFLMNWTRHREHKLFLSFFIPLVVLVFFFVFWSIHIENNSPTSTNPSDPHMHTAQRIFLISSKLQEKLWVIFISISPSDH